MFFRKSNIVIALLFCIVALIATPLSASEFYKWEQLPQLPDKNGKANAGVAGSFSGVHNDVLIIAGGANFEEGLPWEKGRKLYHRDIYIMTRDESKSADLKNYKVKMSEAKLIEPWAYGLSIQSSEGLICIGGEQATYNEAGERTNLFTASCTLVAYDKDSGKIKVTENYLPDMLAKATTLGGSLVDGKIYVVGGDGGNGPTSNFFRFDLKAFQGGDKNIKWETLPSFPGEARVLPVVATQHNGRNDCLYVFSGRDSSDAKNLKLFTDAWQFDPKAYDKATKLAQFEFDAGMRIENKINLNIDKNVWKRLGDIALQGKEPHCVMAGMSIAVSQYHILVIGGSVGKNFTRFVVEFPERLAAAKTDAEKKAIEDERLQLQTNHPGFTKNILAYHTLTDTWTKIGEYPRTGQVTTNAVNWPIKKGRETVDQIVIPSGEISPGIRTAEIWRGIPDVKRSFGTLNYIVLGVYLAALVWMGVFFAGRMKDTDDFFKAGQRIPWWAAGISIFGTQLSAITFMTIPSKTFATDWRYFWGNMAIFAIAPFIIFLFLPFYRRLNVTTAYEFLEMRFNVIVRVFGSLMFMLLQFGRIGIVLYLPSVALAVVTGWNISLCIIVMGILCTIYTIMGGMEAVIWTDVLQVIVLAGGAIIALCLIPFQIPGGWNTMIDYADAQEKLKLLDFRFDWKDATFLTIFIGSTGMQIISYGTDQAVIQRYLTTKTESDAANSVWINAILTIPAAFLFFGIGTALFAFYKANPAAMDPTITNSSALFPFFIVSQLPAGIAGLLIAAIFAASMSSLDSSMNCVSAAFTTDFYRRFSKNVNEKQAMNIARYSTLFIGVIGTLFALSIARMPDLKSVWDQFSKLIGFFGAGLGGLFLLAMFTKRASSKGVIVGLVVSGIVQYFVSKHSLVHAWFFAIPGMIVCFVVGYIASLILPDTGRDLKGLTIYDMKAKEN